MGRASRKMKIALSVHVFLLIFSLNLALCDNSFDDLEGNTCNLDNGESGQCIKITECPIRLNEVRMGKRNALSSGRCGFIDNIEVVCCPVEKLSEKLGERPSDTACRLYESIVNSDSSSESGSDDVEFHIYSGFEAKPSEFPYFAALGYKKDEIKYECGGTLISPDFVLTAAHCVNNIDEKKPIEVRLGSNDLKSRSSSVQVIPVSESFTTGYKRTTYYNDIALIRLNFSARIDSQVRPICLYTKPWKTSIQKSASFIVVGFGATNPNDGNSNKLMRTPNMRLEDNKKCEPHYKEFSRLPDGLKDYMICAKDSNSTRRSDGCHGDSGGPLLMVTNASQSIVGITSFGQACGTIVPGIYTSVYAYLDWIESIVWSTDLRKNSRREKAEKSLIFSD